MSIFSRWKSNASKSPASSSASSSSSSSTSAAVAAPDHGRGAGARPAPPKVQLDEAFDREIFDIGSHFLDLAKRKQAGFFSSQFWSDKLMDWAMKDEAFKIQFFRFVDTYPALKTPDQIHEHLIDYMSQPGVTPPPGMDLMTRAGGMAKGVFTNQMTKQITGMARKFIAGKDAEDATPVLRDLWKRGMSFSVDLLGEACISQRVADAYQEKYLDLVNNLPRLVNDFPKNERLESDHLGPIPRVNVSIKITSLYWDVDPIDVDGSIDRLLERLGPLLQAAGKNNVHINFDIEQAEYKDLTLDLFEKCCEKYDFPAGLALQAYLRSGVEDAKRVIAWSKRMGKQVTVRLVKGAYWDYETIHAEQHGWPIPVWSRKQDTDACFEDMAALFAEQIPRSKGEGGVKLALGSHNARSIAHALACVRKQGLPDNALELQMLHGMGDPLKAAAIEMDMRLREYVPIGELLVGMAYFVRRLLENTSNESWLRASFAEEMSVDTLLANPRTIAPGEEDPGRAIIERAPEKHAMSPSAKNIGDGRPFFNEPPRNFTMRETQRDFQEAIQRADVSRGGRFETNVDDAVNAAHGAFREWSTVPFEKRAEVSTNIARIIRHRRDEIAGMVIREIGYTWREADEEVCDAIDFCEFHARAAIDRFTPKRLGKFIGEFNEMTHEPRGVVLMIAPWAHPLSTLCAVASAALVCGDTVVVVPANEASGITAEFRNMLSMAGAPTDAVRFVEAEPDAPSLMYHSKITTVAYFGHREKGLDVIQATGTTSKDQRVVKNVIAELGGKNAIIVDASADLGEAVTAVRGSAFGRAGQSPLACSRAIVVDTAYDAFLDKLAESTSEMTIGDPIQPGTNMGPIISEEHARIIRNRLEKAKSEGRLLVNMPTPPQSHLAPGRTYIMPHVFADVSPDAITAQEEIMGPVVAVIRASSFEDALEIANTRSSGYALSGGVFSRKPSNIEEARRAFRVGNLFINAPIASPRGGRQPVAINGLSGTLSAMRGGARYLDHFVKSRIVMENTMRRGFAPEL